MIQWQVVIEYKVPNKPKKWRYVKIGFDPNEEGTVVSVGAILVNRFVSYEAAMAGELPGELHDEVRAAIRTAPDVARAYKWRRHVPG